MIKKIDKERRLSIPRSFLEIAGYEEDERKFWFCKRKDDRDEIFILKPKYLNPCSNEFEEYKILGEVCMDNKNRIVIKKNLYTIKNESFEIFVLDGNLCIQQI